MAARAIWKGVIKIAEVVCPVAMYTAASTSERIALHLVNRKTGHRLQRVYVDEKTDKPVEREDQVKGYETSEGNYVVLEPEEIAAAVPESDKSLTVDRFIACNKIEPTFFDKPYYLLPSSDVASETFVLMREALRARKAATIAHAVLFRRLRPVLIRAHHKGLIATTLNSTTRCVLRASRGGRAICGRHRRQDQGQGAVVHRALRPVRPGAGAGRSAAGPGHLCGGR
jgi:DNA end-binding protein Ku